MLDTKYAVKYKMPHTLLHIVDNSSYTNPLPEDVAEDPSLYASIVVTATPMGVDNKIVNVTRADVASVAFGLNSITPDDIRRYGQSIEYPLSLIQNAQAPVLLLRVTPDGSKYAFTTILVQWRIDKRDDGTDEMIVRYVATSKLPTGLRADRFKNTDKLNSEIIKKTESTFEEGDITWNQAVFMNVIAAGRGKLYNNFAFSINFGKQSKMPSNCRYIFSTINTNGGLIVEEFTASLSNEATIDSKKYYQTVDDVNTVVARRLEGSSVLVPYLNKNAVKQVYSDYTRLTKELSDSGLLSDAEIKELATLNVNIFDMVYGNYIYDGSQYDIKLPHYRVDMYNNDISQLPVSDRIYNFTESEYFKYGDEFPVWNKLYSIERGVTADDNTSEYVGNTYIHSSNGNLEPVIDVVASINQYTGVVTYVSYTTVWATIKDPAYSDVRPIYGETELAALVSDIRIPYELVSAGSDGDYSLLGLPAPGDWESNYASYFTKSDSVYVAVVGVAPTYEPNTYYSKSGDVYTVISDETAPTGWEDNYGNYYTRSGESPDYVYTPVQPQAPEFAENTYYQYTGAIENKFNTESLRRLIKNGVIKKNNITAIAFSISDGSYGIASVEVDNEGKLVKVYLNSPDPTDILAAIRFSSVSGSGNIIATKETDVAFDKPGALVITHNTPQTTSGIGSVLVKVNGYNIAAKKNESGITTETVGTKISVPFTRNIIGQTPESTNVDSKLLGHEYDVITYDYTEDNRKAVNTATTGLNYFVANDLPVDIVGYDANNQPVVVGNEVQTQFIPASGGQEPKVPVGTIIAYKSDSSSAGHTPVGIIKGVVTAISHARLVNGELVGDVAAFKVIEAELSYSVDQDSIFDDFYGNKNGAIVIGNSVCIYNESDGTLGDSVGTLTINHRDLRPTDVEKSIEIGVDPDKTTIVIKPSSITRYTITGSTGSLIRPQNEAVYIPKNYYYGDFGVNPSSENGGIKLDGGSTGFFDDAEISDIEFKWRYSELLVKAFRGELDPRIQSPVRCPAKFMFDGGFNTIVGQSILPNVIYKPYDIVNASTVFTDEEKEEVLYNPSIVSKFVDEYGPTNDIDVKQAMYDLMVYRCYYGMPVDKRPIGPGYGLSVHFDAGVTDYNTAMLVNDSFKRRFTNPNASWDIGGYTASDNGVTYTYVKWIVDHLIEHCKKETINKPFVMSYATIPNNAYTSFYPDIDVTDWDLRELLYESGGNSWVPDINGNLVRRSQRTMYDESETSDLLQESNMRTLSQLCYLLQNTIEGALYSYTDDGVLQTLTDLCSNKFSTWQGTRVDSLDIAFERDINPLDGGDIVVCYCNVTFRGLFLRVPIIVNVNRRSS